MSRVHHLQFRPLDPSHTPGGVPPGVLGSINQLSVFQLVRPCGLNLLGHLLQPVYMGLGLKPTGSGLGRGLAADLKTQCSVFHLLQSLRDSQLSTTGISLGGTLHNTVCQLMRFVGYTSRSKDKQFDPRSTR